MFPNVPLSQLHAVLDAVVAEMLSAVGVAAPPVDALAIVRSQGILVAWNDREVGRARYVRLRDTRRRLTTPLILLRPEPREERRQWAVAHEIGEHLADRVFDALEIQPRDAAPASRELVANQLASRLLLPTLWFAADARRTGWDVLALKSRYATASHELIARRMLDLPPPILITIFDQGRQSFRRGNRTGVLPALFPSEQVCWRKVHASGQRAREAHGQWLVQGWPIHEPDWRREILRSEYRGDDDCDAQ